MNFQNLESFFAWTVPSVVAICSLIIPSITTVLCHRHQLKMEKLKYELEKKDAEAAHLQEIFENYLKSAGKCLQLFNEEAVSEFSKYSHLAVLYASEEVSAMMIEFYNQIYHRETKESPVLLTKITLKLRQTLKERTKL